METFYLVLDLAISDYTFNRVQYVKFGNRLFNYFNIFFFFRPSGLKLKGALEDGICSVGACMTDFGKGIVLQFCKQLNEFIDN